MVHTDGNDATDTVARRLFFALWPESAVRDAIAHAASQLVAMQAPDGRPQAAERYAGQFCSNDGGRSQVGTA